MWRFLHIKLLPVNDLPKIKHLDHLYQHFNIFIKRILKQIHIRPHSAHDSYNSFVTLTIDYVSSRNVWRVQFMKRVRCKSQIIYIFQSAIIKMYTKMSILNFYLLLTRNFLHRNVDVKKIIHIACMLLQE